MLKTLYVILLLPPERLSIYSTPRGLNTGGRGDGNVLGEHRADLHPQNCLIYNR